MDTSFILQAALTGLSLGAFCLSYCFPFLATLIASTPRRPKENSKLIFQFIFGRFIGYLLFGFAFGYVGEKFRSPVLTIMTDFSMILISVILVLYLCGVIKQKESCLCSKFHNRNAMAMGLLMGINICPPFLLSLPYVFSLHSTWLGIIYFIVFFLTSSVYFLPMIFVGMLARIKEFRLVARISGFICAGIFTFSGFYSLVHILLPKP
ncbi:MAG: sulfite exporter TauE/SafE family protein [Candidatus Omnitrophica bacterium]|nr:sulfite exporter TauE/SafE family protein [Candidatus Omnitrophota bacterium]MDE2008934.1 sulfite exporter TauE/SafE family protein [Candidatus Omnitrophota bacterium]MDE2213503.1 sulfite exporter TauE/SafE family protein [Candidatus Omnitrophota bacterium]MDE2230596.1 sulfite exporter TauE/SafE family protein [Candidatus Omnitrophota bacterium]